MGERIGGGEQGDAVVAGAGGGDLEGFGVCGGVKAGDGEPGFLAFGLGEGGQGFVQPGAWGGGDEEGHTFGVGEQVWQVQMAFALDGAGFAEGEQAAEAGVAGAVDGVGGDVWRAVSKHQAGAGDEAHAGILGGLVGADDAGEGVAVGDADGGEAEGCCGLGDFLGVAGAVQEAEGGGNQGIDGHLGLSVS